MTPYARKSEQSGSDPALIVTAILVALMCAGVQAQPYPARAVRIVVPLSTGGNVTIVTRAISQKLSENLGQQFIVDNRPGGSGIIGTEIVARSAPDGYTVLAVANSFVSNHGLIAKVPYDPVKDFAGVSLIASLPQVLVVHPSVPVRSVRELIALARAKPEALVHATQGEASTGRIAAEIFTDMTKARFLHVNYKGGGPAMIDLVGGQVSLMFATVSTALPHVKSGRIRALGVTSRTRSPAFPDIPAIAEAGVPGYEALIFNVIVAPAATPRDVRARLQAEIAKVVRIPELHKLFLELGVELVASASPEECTEFIRQQFDVHNRLWKRLGLTPQ